MRHPRRLFVSPPRVALVVVNVTLLAVLLLVTLVPTAQSQVAGARARGQYTMVAGKTNAGGPHAVYVLDSNNQEMIALRWDSAKNSLVGIGYRNLALDGGAVPGR